MYADKWWCRYMAYIYPHSILFYSSYCASFQFQTNSCKSYQLSLWRWCKYNLRSVLLSSSLWHARMEFHGKLFIEKIFYAYVSFPKLNLSSIISLSLSLCLLYTSPSPRDLSTSRMPSFAWKKFFFFFFNDTATTEIYTLHIVGSVRCV